MNNRKFISLDEYLKETEDSLLNEDYANSFGLANDTLLEAGNINGSIGNIINRGLSYVPRATRFRKAKLTMLRSARSFIKRSKKLIVKFEKNFNEKVNIIDKEYKNLLRIKINHLIKNGKEDQAVTLMINQKKELEDYKKEQMNQLNKSIDDILQVYTNAINKRIETPGFVFNVELSEKGKGDLMAKWTELTTIAKMRVDKYKTNIIRSKGWKRLDEIISEIDSFIQSRKYSSGEHEADFHIISAEPAEKEETYFVKVYLRIPGSRPIAKERGVIWGPDSDKLSFGGKFTKSIKPGVASISGWTSKVVNIKKTDYIRPYIKISDSPVPLYGEITQLSQILNISKTDRITQSDRSLSNETDILPINKNQK